jgi:hypothetical protein
VASFFISSDIPEVNLEAYQSMERAPLDRLPFTRGNRPDVMRLRYSDFAAMLLFDRVEA